jgi:Fe-S-cluster containining protein
MESLEVELDRARDLDEAAIADAIQSIGFECTRCGACCTAADDPDAGDGDSHTATVFPDEVRQLQAVTGEEWRDVARPMPYGLSTGHEGSEGETFEWALQTDACGDCAFYAERSASDLPGEAVDAGDSKGRGTCTVHADRPLICRTYPFSLALGGTSQPMGTAVDGEGLVRAHECEGLGRKIDRERAEELAGALATRATRELEEAIAVRNHYEPADADSGDVVVHDSEGAKRPDGSPF